MADAIWELVGEVVVGLFFITGEFLRWAITLGRHRVRWWDGFDAPGSLSSFLLGLAFWGGSIALAVWLL